MRPPAGRIGAETFGMKIATPVNARPESIAANRKVARQPKVAPTTLPRGTPKTKARVMPAETMAMAEPRRSGGDRAAAATVAPGMASEPVRPASARSGSRTAKLGLAAQARCRRTPTPRPVITRTRRSMWLSRQASRGPPSAPVST